MLIDLTPDATIPVEFEFDAPETRDKSRLMMAVDSINGRSGRGAIHLGSAVDQGTRWEWSMKQERLTRLGNNPISQAREREVFDV